jgi:hypothetical protein
MPPGRYEVQVGTTHPATPVPSLWTPSVTATVTGLRQLAAVSATVLRPYVDGVQDTVRFTASSNLPTTGAIRIVTSSGRLVRAVVLGRGTGWAMTWSGRDAHGRRVANGTYRADIRLVGRGVAATRLALLTVRVLPSRASAPVVTLSSRTLTPARHGARGAITVRATDVVPSTWVWRIRRAGRVVWWRSFTRRVTAAAAWGGVSTSGVGLRAGSYTLSITARGGEGASVTTSRPLVIAPAR